VKKIIRRLTVAVLPLLCLAVRAESLQSYVQQCQSELGFNASDVLAADCHNGFKFAGSGFGPVNDFVGYQRVNDTVDLVFACRWVNIESDPAYDNKTAASIELIIHNRQNGSTCFFNAKDTNTDINLPRRAVATAIVSPTNFGSKHPNANDYWLQPSELDAKMLPSDGDPTIPHPNYKEPIRCVGCHVSGPYIASYNIIMSLDAYGLINNGHDTLGDMKSTAPRRYHAVGSNPYDNPNGGPSTSAFKAWDSIIYKNNVVPVGCTNGCHNVGYNSTVGTLSTITDSFSLIPSLKNVDIPGVLPEMPPTFDTLTPVYRWVNMDTPTNGDGAEYETLLGLGIQYPNFYCSNPTNLEAHAVGLRSGSVFDDDPSNFDQAFSVNEMSLIPNKLRNFNLRDGLVCLNADQSGGNTCRDYRVSYYCNGSWVDAPNHSLTATGDSEPRSSFTGCTSPAAIQARYNKGTAGSPNWVFFDGPNDRLAQFNNKGLICVNADQGPNQTCSNYVVKFSCPGDSAPPATPSFKSSWSGMMLTATSQQTDGETRGQPDTPGWNSQDWVIEPVKGTVNVRIKNVWNGKYLNVQNQNESARIVTYDSNPNWTSQQWTIEPVVNSNEVRFKNVWTAKYLTLVDTSTYSAILSQSLNPLWPSQRWTIQ